jgi:hypothetical protein
MELWQRDSHIVVLVCSEGVALSYSWVQVEYLPLHECHRSYKCRKTVKAGGAVASYIITLTPTQLKSSYPTPPS